MNILADSFRACFIKGANEESLAPKDMFSLKVLGQSIFVLSWEIPSVQVIPSYRMAAP